ncbi:glyoxalase [Polaribacter reichenbachii]|uniref:Glyoxalase n=1 Tax=Polaribacter reichenbachii TaxID=996801 RepID=A0A1B8U5N6_9FLAO|nr:glyoxalase [Polaribacter reichenbachii]APZ47880.1 glyoxalase [Polaribacter reichenbachii]AUC18514.1 glyoxalase [Polaribacter reichenbachii]OBY67171.1 glyoxalase [Polaribacter reichenbachii]
MRKERLILSDLVNANTTETEAFQNSVLRPIIKMQHTLLIAFFKSYLIKRKIDFSVLSEQKKRAKIKSVLEKDLQFKNQILGAILGHFSLDEYEVYQNNSSEFNRRIKQIITKRLQDSIAEIK